VRGVLSKLDNLLLVAVLAGGGWFGYEQLRGDAPAAETVIETGRGSDAPSPAERLLATLPVKGRAPKTGYDRRLFGVGSLDFDRNGCDVRNDVLQRDLYDVEVKPGTNGCKVLRGHLLDPYTGKDLAFESVGGGGLVEVDHVVALSDAWQKGAQQLSADERVRFANDPDNLLAVNRTANRQKGDGDAATWLPRRAFRCEYVARQIQVKATYHLWVTAAERDAMRRVLAACP
jgi:hypothetical protein